MAAVHVGGIEVRAYQHTVHLGGVEIVATEPKTVHLGGVELTATAPKTVHLGGVVFTAFRGEMTVDPFEEVTLDGNWGQQVSGPVVSLPDFVAPAGPVGYTLVFDAGTVAVRPHTLFAPNAAGTAWIPARIG